ncbi:hypothetical protein KCU78_g7277, partial [Aureobasidium melanogenum]
MSYEYSLSWQRDSLSHIESINGVEPEGGWDPVPDDIFDCMDMDEPMPPGGNDTPIASSNSSAEAALPRATKKRKGAVSKGSESQKKKRTTKTTKKPVANSKPERPDWLRLSESDDELAGPTTIQQGQSGTFQASSREVRR